VLPRRSWGVPAIAIDTSAGIQRLRGTSAATLSRSLWTRGLWLVALELLVVRPLVQFEFDLRLLACL
jgi:hypothetical protein